MSRLTSLGVAFAAAWSLGTLAWAEDPPPAPPVAPPAQAPPSEVPPSELPLADAPPLEGVDAQRLLEAPQGPLDLRAFVLTLEGQLRELKTPPRKTPTDHALFDAWTSILEPRVSRMAARLKRIAEEPRWTHAPGGAPGSTGLILTPEAWDVVVREAASLYAELGGALEQYTRFRVSFTAPAGFGLLGPGAGVPDPSAQDRALERLFSLESALEVKLASGQLIWTAELTWYWNLARRAELELRRFQEDLERWQRQVAAFEDLQARVAYGLTFQRQSLRMLMFGVRSLLAALQAAEEDRLRVVVEALAPDHARRADAQALLAELRTARNAAEAHSGAQPSGWGTLLRQRWMGPRLRLRALIGA